MPKTDNKKAKGLEMLKAESSVEEIASELGVKVDTVRGWRRDLEKQAREIATDPGREKLPDLFSVSIEDEGLAGDALDAQVPDLTYPDRSLSAIADKGEQAVSGAERERPDATKDATLLENTYGQQRSGQTSVDVDSQTWLLATNHQNMAYMLSAGMFMSPTGFGGKHYHDPATFLPGWLPLFRNNVPRSVIKDCVSERRDLRLCIAEVNVALMGGLIREIRHDGEIRDTSLPGKVDEDVLALLIPTPWPTTLLTRLHFLSDSDQKEFKAVCSNGATIDLSSIDIGISEQVCSDSLQMSWPPGSNEDFAAYEGDDTPPVWGQVIGGIIAMLFHLANKSDLCCSAYRVIVGAGNDRDIEAIRHDAVLAELPYWLASREISQSAPMNAQLYWGVAQALIKAHLDKSTAKPIDTVLQFLEEQSTAEAHLDRSRLDRLIKTMKDVLGMARGTITDLLKQHPGSLSRPLLLLCFRERCKDLLEFSRPDLRDEELVLAAILFAIRDGGWRKLPWELRRPDSLADYAMHRMCDLEQERRVKGRLTFGSEASRPKSLRELVAEGGTWTTTLDDHSFGGFARRLGWSDCIVTRVRLPEGEYCLRHSPGGLTIEFQGIVEGISVEVHKDNLTRRVAHLSLPSAEIQGELGRILARERG